MAVTDYFSELEAVGSNGASPMMGGSTYHTPSMSRRSSARRTVSSSPPRDSSSSPPPMPTTNGTNGGDKHDDDVLRDPRRFTPTLHASLVSEILNLRRELDSKHRFIEDLETSLQHAKIEKDEVSDQLSRVDKDRRFLKRNMQQLESGTLSALEELAKDRDDTKRQYRDLKAKLDEAQEKIKRKEEESDRTHSAWEKEQNAWETERRAFERRVHITESRLKTVLVELEATHQAHAQMQEQMVSGEDDDNTKDSGLGDDSDTASQASPRRNASHRRTMSNSSRRSFNRMRYSVQSIPGMDKMGGISLADELHLDEEDEDAMSEAESEHREYTQQEMVARKIQFFDEKAKRLSKVENRRTLQQPINFTAPRVVDQEVANSESADLPRSKVQYVDSAVQYTPPSSPKLSPQSNPDVVRQYSDSGVQYEPIDPAPDMPSDIETRKDSKVGVYPYDIRNGMSTPPLLVDRGVSPIDSPRKSSRNSMVSAGSQTMEDPLSPPATPGVSPPLSPTEFMPVHPPLPEMKTMSTQTDFREEQKSIITYTSKNRPYPLLIPSITITEPPSAPSSPKEPKLPPGTKNAWSQTTADLITMNSVSVQTEKIEIDLRLAKLPPHLHPSTISSSPLTSESLKSRPSTKKKSSMANPPSRSALRSPSPMEDDIPSSPPTIYAPTPLRKSETIISSDSGSSASDRVEGLRKLLRSSILAPAFGSDTDRSDADESRRGDAFIQTEPKVAAFSTPNMSSRSMKHLRQLGGTRPSPVPEERDEHDQSHDPFPLHPDHSLMGRSSIDTEKSKSSRAMSIKSGSSKQQTMRRSIISGSSAHRSRTPSIGSVGSSSYFSSMSAGPPFPVPDRASSKKLFSSRSEGSSSPTPRSGIFSSKRRNNPPVSRKDSLRKVKSATVIQRSNSRGRNRSRSPPSRKQPASPTYPPLPKDNYVNSSRVNPSQKALDKRSSQALSPNSKPGAARTSQGTVVDSIAATMVGEWMWKYVRRRTSFGVPESPLQDQIGRPGTDGSVNVTGNGVRHRRWVWLSPYERAIMWSSKQPASNSALMGKSGRKLVIQSVLDVRDDTPLPKNHGIAEPFNRSILILTPARALKFTAMSRERHYTWLTALSFLAHSPLLAPGLANLPPPPEEPPLELQGQRSRSATLKRGGAIRDSVRIAKDRARPVKTPRSDHSQATIPEIEFQAAFGNAVPIPPIPGMPDIPAEAVAEPPNVPRFAHGRKRSLTGPSRMPTSSIARGFAYREVSSPVFPMPSLPSPSLDYPSGRTSQASSAGTRSTFLDTVGTIRMEAFIDEQASMPNFSPESNRRGNTLHSPLDGKRGGMILGEDYDVGGSSGFDPFKDFNAPY